MTTNNDQTAELTDAELEALTAPPAPEVAPEVEPAPEPAAVGPEVVVTPAPDPVTAPDADFVPPASRANTPSQKAEKDNKAAEDALWAKALQRNPRLKRPSA